MILSEERDSLLEQIARDRDRIAEVEGERESLKAKLKSSQDELKGAKQRVCEEESTQNTLKDK